MISQITNNASFEDLPCIAHFYQASEMVRVVASRKCARESLHSVKHIRIKNHNLSRVLPKYPQKHHDE